MSVERYARNEDYFDAGIYKIKSTMMDAATRKDEGGFIESNNEISRNKIIRIADACSSVNRFKDLGNTIPQKKAMKELFKFCVDFSQKSGQGLKEQEFKSMVLDTDFEIRAAFRSQNEQQILEYQILEKEREKETLLTLQKMAKDN